VIVHQSTITSWTRCPQAVLLENQGHRQIQTSALSFGTVMHYALEVFERQWRTGATTWAGARREAIETFRHYWHPLHIEAVCAPVELWLPRQSYAGLARIGVEGLAWYAEWAKDQDEELLATEFGFSVPIEGTWDYELDAPHILNGTVDRLSAKRIKGFPILDVGDYKTGKTYTYLRQNVQFSAYGYASTRREFWCGWNGEDGFGERGEEMYQRFRTAARHGTWFSLKTQKVMDAGWRGPDDYTRFALAVEQVVASMRADIYPLSMAGENCSYCPYRQVCAGVGIPGAEHGAPTR
jgi:ATP-dependent helicase/DNAse subunit B